MSRPGLVPFRQFVLKVHSRCDLACDHCYVFEHADQSWRGRPKRMSEETVAQAASRIREHACAHRLAEVCVVLHGGEPLLVGEPGLRRIVERLHRELDGHCELDLRIHTNGVLLNERFCDLFAEYGIKVGISLDGDKSANDRHRTYADGRSSYEQVISAIRLLQTERYRPLFAGLLCTIDVANDPIAVFASLVALDPPNIDFLLPHATWDDPPPRSAPPTETPPYADWLTTIFDRWMADGRPVPIRIFDSIIRTTHGGMSSTESLGLAPSELIVIETDGSLEQVDSLKVAYDGAPETGLDVFSHTLEQAAVHPGIVARQGGLDDLCDTCRGCPVVESCGGGLYSHRYRTGSGFDNPSVFCADLLSLITHVRSRIEPSHAVRAADPGREDVPSHVLVAADLDAVAAGFGDAGAITALENTQRSLRRVLLAAVREGARVHGQVTAAFSAARELLDSIDRSHPAVLADVTSHPYVRAWAARCLRRLRDDPDPTAGTEVPMATDLEHLAVIAAAAAVRAGVSAELSLPVLDGAVHLPTLGRLLTGPVENAQACIDQGRITVRAGTASWTVTRGEHSPAWQPVRQLKAAGFQVALEDTDPYRDCHQWPAAARLPESEVLAWQQTFSDAWALIRRDHPSQAEGLKAGLSTVMPLAEARTGDQISAAARQAFGAVGVALPAEADTLALLLIHEFQHVKLGAVLDLLDLFDEADTRLYPAPWRDDPRPFEGLLQGTYAHVSVTDFWRIRRHTAEGESAGIADAQFAHWRLKTAEAIQTLMTSGSLTPTGQRFVARMDETVSPWLDEPIAAATRTLV